MSGASTPVSWPAIETRKRSNCRGSGAQYADSFRRRIVRWKLTPHVCAWASWVRIELSVWRQNPVFGGFLRASGI